MTVEAKNAASVPAITAMLQRRGLTESVYVNTNSPEVAQAIHAAGLHAHLYRTTAQMRTDVPSRWAGFVDLLDVDVHGTDDQLRAAAALGISHRLGAHRDHPSATGPGTPAGPGRRHHRRPALPPGTRGHLRLAHRAQHPPPADHHTGE